MILIDYFKLQYKLQKRYFSENAINPIIAFFFIVATFIGLSYFLFYKLPEWGQYIYLMISFLFINKLSKRERNDFLRICFNNTAL